MHTPKRKVAKEVEEKQLSGSNVRSKKVLFLVSFYVEVMLRVHEK